VPQSCASKLLTAHSSWKASSRALAETHDTSIELKNRRRWVKVRSMRSLGSQTGMRWRVGEGGIKVEELYISLCICTNVMLLFTFFLSILEPVSSNLGIGG